MTRAGLWISFLVVLAVSGTSCSKRTPPPGPPAAPSPPAITDGRSLLAAMQRRYGGQWVKTLSFTQNNTLYTTRGESKSQWRQQLSIPGKLRIDYLPLTQRSGVLFDGTRIHTFDNGRAIDVQPGINPVLLITADVYVLPLERSAHVLDSLGFALSQLRRDTWEGQPVYVVGAPAGDSTTSQFWVDAERLVAVRVVQKEKSGTRNIVTDARFSKFVDQGGFPIPTEVVRYRDGRLVFREQYVDVRVNEAIAEATFDPTKWSGTPRP